MLFNKKFAKFGKGKNISCALNENGQIDVYFFDGGIGKKQITYENGYKLKRKEVCLGYNMVIPLCGYLVTRYSSLVGVIKDE